MRRKLTEHAADYIQAFVRRVSNSNEFDFAVHLGDLIQDLDLETDRANLRKALQLFKCSTKPLYHLIGNHDVKHLPLAEVLSELGYTTPYYSFDKGNWHFVFLFSEIPDQVVQKSIISEQQFAWLKDDLLHTSYPVVVFCHHSLADQDLAGNPWFDGRPDACLVENRSLVRDLFNSCGRVRCVINGHLHWNRVDLHSRIPFITVQSATENFRDDGTPANSWAVLELGEESLGITVHGNDPMSYCSYIWGSHNAGGKDE